MKVLFVVFCATLFLASCKTVEPKYYYGAYQKAVYSYFKGTELSISQQIQILEEVVEQARVKGKPVAPGLHAHLGMLYFESGNARLGSVNFELEKAMFPESKIYLDFLLNQQASDKI